MTMESSQDEPSLLISDPIDHATLNDQVGNEITGDTTMETGQETASQTTGKIFNAQNYSGSSIPLNNELAYIEPPPPPGTA